MKNEEARQQIQRLKELPTLAPDVEKIVRSCEDPEIDFQRLAKVLATSPTITARLLGLSNSAFFGQQGKVHTLEHATVVLGLPTVRSIAIGLAFSGMFRLTGCPRFKLERYWLTAIIAAAFGQELQSQVAAKLQLPFESVPMAGLLHNLGLLALVHLFPAEVDQALAAYHRDPSPRLGHYLEESLGITHYQAGAWMGGKWHLPRDLLLVMEHHHDYFYRGEQWPLVLLTGLAARWAVDLLNSDEHQARWPAEAEVASSTNAFLLKVLAIKPATGVAARQEMATRLAAYRGMAATLVAG